MILDGIDLTKRRFLIAEIGNNHEGDASLAMEMVAAAAEAGADAIKVQAITPDRLVNISQSERIVQLSKFKLSLETFQEMAQLARSKGSQFMASAFDLDSLDEILDLISAAKNCVIGPHFQAPRSCGCEKTEAPGDFDWYGYDRRNSIYHGNRGRESTERKYP